MATIILRRGLSTGLPQVAIDFANFTVGEVLLTTDKKSMWVVEGTPGDTESMSVKQIVPDFTAFTDATTAAITESTTLVLLYDTTTSTTSNISITDLKARVGFGIDTLPAYDPLNVNIMADFIPIYSAFGTANQKISLSDLEDLILNGIDGTIQATATGDWNYITGTDGTDGILRTDTSMEIAIDASGNFSTISLVLVDGGTF